MDKILNDKPLRLKLVRKYNRPNYCIGRLYVNGRYFSDTMEPADVPDDSDEVLESRTCPSGNHDIEVSEGILWVERMNPWGVPVVDEEHKKKVLDKARDILLSFPHGANYIPEEWANYTESYILVGFNTRKGELTDTKRTWNILMEKYILPAVNAKREIEFEITRTYELETDDDE